MRRRPRTDVQANLTPMIDVTFLLIVFFVVVSQIVEVENVDLDLPRPADPATDRPGEGPRIVVNVLPGPGGTALGYRAGARAYGADPAGLEALTAGLAAAYRDNPAVGVNLRADRLTHYRWVEPVFEAVAAAARRAGRPGAAGRVNLVVVRED